MPWTVENPPAVAQNWTEAEQRRCVDAANATLEETGDEQQAIFACIRAAGKTAGKAAEKGSRMATRTIVAGAPCSGKSSYVRERLTRGELVYDYDTMHQALSGQASHEHDDQIRPYVLAAREAVLGLLAASTDTPAWVITSSPWMAELRRLQDLLGAEVVLLNVDQAEAHRRCGADSRPEAWHGYIDNWFAATDIEAGEWVRKAIEGKRGRMMETKAYPITEFKALGDEGEGVFEAIVAVFGNVDRKGERIMPGAFKKTLAAWEKRGRSIPVIYNHNWDDINALIGSVLRADEVDLGLYVKGQLDIDEEFARKVWRKMSQGMITDFSFGFLIENDRWDRNVHELLEVDVLEVGPTVAPVNPAAHLISVKADPGPAELTAISSDAGGGDDAGQGGGGVSETDQTVTPRTSRRSLLAARMVFGELVKKTG